MGETTADISKKSAVWPYMIVRACIFLWLLSSGLPMLLSGIYSVINGNMAAHAGTAFIGAAFLGAAVWIGVTTVDLLKGRRDVGAADKIGAVLLVCAGMFMFFFLYLSRDYFLRPMKELRAATETIEKEVPGIKRWDSLGREERKSALPALIVFLEHDSRPVRSRAADCIGKMGEDASEAVPALVKMMEREQTIPSAAAGTLAKLGPKGNEALLAALESKDTFVSGAAHFALYGKVK